MRIFRKTGSGTYYLAAALCLASAGESHAQIMQQQIGGIGQMGGMQPGMQLGAMGGGMMGGGGMMAMGGGGMMGMGGGGMMGMGGGGMMGMGGGGMMGMGGGMMAYGRRWHDGDGRWWDDGHGRWNDGHGRRRHDHGRHDGHWWRRHDHGRHDGHWWRRHDGWGRRRSRWSLGASGHHRWRTIHDSDCRKNEFVNFLPARKASSSHGSTPGRLPGLQSQSDHRQQRPMTCRPTSKCSR